MERLNSSFGGRTPHADTVTHRYAEALRGNRNDIRALFAFGPSAALARRQSQQQR